MEGNILTPKTFGSTKGNLKEKLIRKEVTTQTQFKFDERQHEIYMTKRKYILYSFGWHLNKKDF